MDFASDRVNSLRVELGFTAVDSDTSVGEISGVLASLTHLSSEPLAILVRLRLRPDAGEPDVVSRIFDDVPPEAARITFEPNFASISLYEIDDLPNDAVRLLLEKVADVIAANQLSAPAGCLRCGIVDGAQLMYLEDRPTRLCPACLEGARLEKKHLEQQLNRGTVGGFFGLPAVVASVAAGWAILWTAVDWLLEFFRIGVIWIDKFSVIMILFAVLGFGVALGMPLGNALKRSGLARWSPLFMSLVFGLGAAVLGELVYVTILVFRAAGVVDVNTAVQIFQGVVQQYSTFWIVVKVGLALAISFFCLGKAATQETARLDV
jgi:hypothetical protein